MGLVLNKDRDGKYRRTWYAIVCGDGTHWSEKLKTPLRGKIPLDESGRFSIKLKGDDAFEASKAKALEELAALIEDKKDGKGRDAGGRKRKSIRLADLAETNATRARYRLVKAGDKGKDGHPLTEKEAKSINKYNESAKCIIADFADFARKYAKHQRGRKYIYLDNLDREIVGTYLDTLANGSTEYALPNGEQRRPQSWQTIRKYVFILKAVFAYYMPKDAENPFQMVYEDGFKGRKCELDKSSVVHEAPSIEQIRRVWDYARTLTDKPYLHRLAVIACCTGMRCGDCCNLTWDKVDLLNYRITTKTAKTGKEIAVPIFDYEPDSADFHEVLGELRRELEAALAERRDGERFVVPEAARIYKNNPSRINKEGKAVFARGLFAEEDEPEEAVLVGEEKEQKTEKEIIVAIETAKMQAEKKSRLVRVFKLHKSGKSLGEIAALVGKRKGSISEDLAEIEQLTGERLRAGNPYMGANAKQGLRELLKKTRRERAQGQRCACLFGWHSCRVFFVVTAVSAGIKPEDLKLITGHATVRMVLHYYNPEELAAAEKMRSQIQQKRKPLALPQTAESVQSVPALPAAKSKKERLLEIQELFDEGLISEDERESQRARVLAEI